jgi:hypothetical protein
MTKQSSQTTDNTDHRHRLLKAGAGSLPTLIGIADAGTMSSKPASLAGAVAFAVAF